MSAPKTTKATTVIAEEPIAPATVVPARVLAAQAADVNAMTIAALTAPVDRKVRAGSNPRCCDSSAIVVSQRRAWPTV
ncbi:hypothetical protein [Saccharothrix saharensis]|uniref:hypothetical protein n=1 Tax=Saccharothrix saharensis TaxID=571190 RepID=UPI001478783C|nr:hypothetical protein [Saccharothrix saharensis]